MALVGVTLTIIGQKGLSAAELGVGVLAMLAAAACWALMGALVRLWLAEVPPTLAVSAVFTLVTPAFLLTALLGAGGTLLPAVGLRVWLLLAASSLIGLGLAYPLYYGSLPRLGLALASGLGLLIPLLVGVFSALVLGERLSWLQLVGALLLLPGVLAHHPGPLQRSANTLMNVPLQFRHNLALPTSTAHRCNRLQPFSYSGLLIFRADFSVTCR